MCDERKELGAVKKHGSLPFRAEEFHLKPRPEIEGICRSVPGSIGTADIRIARARARSQAGKTCRGFYFRI